MELNKWYLIVCDKDMNNRVKIKCGNEPKAINHRAMEFNTKKELKKFYEKMINEYIDISYDWKGHSQGAVKFYHDGEKFIENKVDFKKNEEGKIDVMTYLLVYHNGDEVMKGLFD